MCLRTYTHTNMCLCMYTCVCVHACVASCWILSSGLIIFSFFTSLFQMFSTASILHVIFMLLFIRIRMELNYLITAVIIMVWKHLIHAQNHVQWIDQDFASFSCVPYLKLKSCMEHLIPATLRWSSSSCMSFRSLSMVSSTGSIRTASLVSTSASR